MSNATTTGPTLIGVTPEKIPKALRDLRQWVLWRLESRDDDKPTKIPYTIKGKYAKTSDASTWAPFDAALGAFKSGRYSGIGFVFTKDDSFIGADLDDCRDPETGEIEPWAKEIIERLNTYAEVSPSGRGVKAYAEGKLPTEQTGKKKPWKSGAVEMYQRGRYFCATGLHVEGTPLKINDAQTAIDGLWNEIFADDEAANVHHGGEQNVIHGSQKLPKASIIDRARKYIAKISPAISGQGGQDDTYHVACVLVLGFDLSAGLAYPLLAEWNQSCKPPWSEHDLRHKLSDADKQSGPRGYLLNSTPAANGKARNGESSARGKSAGSGSDEQSKGVIVNAEVVTVPGPNGKPTTETHSIPLPNIIQEIGDQSDGWPRRVGSALFIDDKGAIIWLDKTPALFGWLRGRMGGVVWRESPSCATKGEMFERLRQTARQYKAVEAVPHHPKMAGHYYAYKIPVAGNGAILRELLDRFRPATDLDRDLIQAAIMTTIWGGPGGTRPAFVITSDDGRGAGKSKLVEMIGHIVGGALQFSHKEEMKTIKTRVLSPNALTKRLALLDNVKTLRFSWGELESVITAPEIGGHAMYQGEGTRPGTLTWFITLNGASLSTDMAQRCVIIKVEKPPRSGSWEEDTVQFILKNREALIADIIGALQAEAVALDRFTRWATWEKHVLARLPEPNDAQKMILERQSAVDVEEEEAGLIEEHITSKLRWLGYDVDGDRVFIPSRIIARWYNDSTNDNLRAQAVTGILKQMITEKRLTRIERNRCNDWGRGFVWIGQNAVPDTAAYIDVERRISDKMRDES